ncbi:MAG: sulfotransferase domain-containing protein, partial [Chloroflexota bacterium]
MRALLSRASMPLRMNYRLRTSAQRQLPYFIVIGAQKGGTTSLIWNLGDHPQIKRALAKEIHFFDLNFSRGEDWYRAYFPPQTSRTISGEATPAYLFYPFIAERIAQLVPNVKLIALLRDPVSRAYSHIQMEARKGRVKGNVLDVLRRDLRFLQQHPLDRERFERYFYEMIARTPQVEYPRDQAALKSSASDREPFPLRSFLLRGFYFVQLSIWFEHFSRDQILILKSEDYFANPRSILEQVIPPFLGLSNWTLPVYQPQNQEYPYPAIDPALSDELHEFFRPYNQKLYHLLGVDFG